MQHQPPISVSEAPSPSARLSMRVSFPLSDRLSVFLHLIWYILARLHMRVCFPEFLTRDPAHTVVYVNIGYLPFVHRDGYVTEVRGSAE